MNLPWGDLIIGGVLAGGLWLLWMQNRLLLQRLQALQTEAAALKTHTDRFLALFTELSPENLVRRVKAMEELLAKEAEARVREVQREWKKDVNAALTGIATAEEKNKRLAGLAENLLDMYGETTSALAFALYELPSASRVRVFALIQNERVKKVVNDLVAAIEKEHGPSDAEKAAAFGRALRLALSAGPDQVTTSLEEIAKVRRLRPTDVTPGTPAEPGGETRTSP